MPEDVGNRRPGRQRDPAVDDAILAAALEVLVEQGYGEFTMHSVISRAGVSSATLYRRWATSDDLVLAVLRSIQPEPLDIDSGSLDGDIAEFVDYLVGALQSLEDVAAAEASGPRAPESLRMAVGEMFAGPRIAMLRTILQRALARGELVSMPSVGHCWTHVVSPLHTRLYLQGETLTPEFVAGTKVVLGAGLRALAARRRADN
ncbi:TetR/AcrR family transcriptional regulator [Haliea sp. E17]|uniref:TetR/AcrR family transcriptional regulator n=1 Tax=Haliea sp. E17 TaxID=3401576 RepID=UPI003AAF5A62